MLGQPHTTLGPPSRTRAAFQQRQQQQQQRQLLHARSRQRSSSTAVCSSWRGGGGSSYPSVGAEEAKRLVEREGYKILDVRSAKQYDYGHITKPTRCCISTPACQNDSETPSQQFLDVVAAAAPSRAAKLIVMCSDGGRWSDAALQQLAAAAYSDVLKLEGGYDGWSQVWSPSGKRRPPPGRWVSTGKEALKSGLNIPGVAESYDEGGNLIKPRWASGLREGETLPP